MTSIRKSQFVPFTCEQMYRLVNDVEKYNQFVPYCSDTQVHHRDEDEVQATIVISAMGVSKSFTTRNRLQVNKMIEMRMVDGPFNHLEGFWRFDEQDSGCLISFDLEFELAGSVFSMMLGPVFDQVMHKMVDAFSERAEVVYGTR